MRCASGWMVASVCALTLGQRRREARGAASAVEAYYMTCQAAPPPIVIDYAA